MSTKFCLKCNTSHDYYEWKYRTWEEGEGWVCGKHTKISYPEFVPDGTKEDRIKYFNSTLQPYREGELSKEYLDAHGTKGISPTKTEIKGAKNTWGDLKGHKTRKKSL